MINRRSTKYKIVSVATQMFFEKGIEKTTFKNIADQLNITQPAIYAHFKNKQDIIFHCIDTAFLELQDYLEQKLNVQLGTKERLFNFLFHYFNWAQSQPAQFFILNLINSYADQDPRAKQLIVKLIMSELEHIESILESGLKENIWTFENQRTLSHLIQSMLHMEGVKLAQRIENQTLQNVIERFEFFMKPYSMQEQKQEEIKLESENLTQSLDII